MSVVIQLLAGRRENGSPVHEEVLAESLGETRYKVLRTPGLVLGIAADDVIRIKQHGEFEILARGGNIAIQIFPGDAASTLEPDATRRFAALGGRLDGKHPRLLVYTVPVTAGFDAVERALNSLLANFKTAEWYYGNIYEPADGVTPLNWWA